MSSAGKGRRHTSDRRHMDGDRESGGQSRKSYSFRNKDQHAGSWSEPGQDRRSVILAYGEFKYMQCVVAVEKGDGKQGAVSVHQWTESNVRHQFVGTIISLWFL